MAAVEWESFLGCIDDHLTAVTIVCMDCWISRSDLDYWHVCCVDRCLLNP